MYQVLKEKRQPLSSPGQACGCERLSAGWLAASIPWVSSGSTHPPPHLSPPLLTHAAPPQSRLPPSPPALVIIPQVVSLLPLTAAGVVPL